MEDAESRILPHTIQMLDLGKQYNVRLFKETLTTVGDQRGAWCCAVHERMKSVKALRTILAVVGNWAGGGVTLRGDTPASQTISLQHFFP